MGSDLRWKNNSGRPLGIAIDNQLKFDNHISLFVLLEKENLSSIARITDDLSFHQKRRLIKAFSKSQFKSCSLTWMFHSRTSNKNINLLHETAIRMVFNDKT